MALTAKEILNTSYTDDMPIFVSIYDRPRGRPKNSILTKDNTEYISICDKPKKAIGRPTTCKMSDEQKKEKIKLRSRKYYADNHEHCILRQFNYDEKKRNTIK
jgi:hypothetical protein